MNHTDKFGLSRDDRLPRNLVHQNMFYKCKALDFDQTTAFNLRIENYTVSMITTFLLIFYLYAL